MDATGGCYCGAVRYRITGEPMLKAQCHCRECQYISGGGANFFMLIPEDGFAYTSGTPKQFSRSDLDTAVTREFCPDCGTHMLTRLPGRDQVVVKVGTLDDPSQFAPSIAIYTMDRQPFHQIAEGLPSFERLPPR
ncbi:GFA family protein [Arenibacterium sp. CAU 1754]